MVDGGFTSSPFFKKKEGEKNMFMRLYSYKDKLNRVDKSGYLTEKLYIPIIYYKDDTDIRNPIVIIEVDSMSIFDDINYARLGDKHYFIIKYEILGNDDIKLYLKLDVLFTYSYEIMHSKGLILRSKYVIAPTQPYPIDDRIPLQNYYTKIEETIDTTSAVINTHFTEPNDSSANNIIVATQGGNYTYNVPLEPNSTSYNNGLIITPPTNTTLPSIKTKQRINNNIWVCTMNRDDFNGLCKFADEKKLTSFIIGAWISPYFVINNEYYGYMPLGTKDDGTSNVYHTTTSRFNIPMYRDISPYLVVAKFTLNKIYPNNDTLDFIDKEPYSYTEVYLPFYGWYTLNRARYIGDTFIIYYSSNYANGDSYVYLYDTTKDIIVFSTKVDMLQPLCITSTNNAEIQAQKNSNILNASLGVVGGTLAVVGGSVTGNPIAIAGGVATIGGTIAKSVNANNHLFMEGQHSAVTSNSSIYDDKQVKVFTYYREPRLPDLNTYVEMNGLAINIYTDDFSEFEGYTELKIELPCNVDVDAFTLSYEDVKEIESLCLSGIYL